MRPSNVVGSNAMQVSCGFVVASRPSTRPSPFPPWSDSPGAFVHRGSPHGSGSTPLHTSAIYGSAEAAELLLSSGAPLEAADWRGLGPQGRMRYWRY